MTTIHQDWAGLVPIQVGQSPGFDVVEFISEGTQCRILAKRIGRRRMHIPLENYEPATLRAAESRIERLFECAPAA